MKRIPYILLGILLTMFVIYLAAPSMMINKKKSEFSFEMTVAKIKENIEQEGWLLQRVKRIDKSVQKHGENANVKVALLEICHPKYAAQMINDKESTHISVMMPCTISVYETAEGEVYIATMNIKPMAWLFGGKVKEVMGGAVYEAQKKFVQF